MTVCTRVARLGSEDDGAPDPDVLDGSRARQSGQATQHLLRLGRAKMMPTEMKWLLLLTPADRDGSPGGAYGHPVAHHHLWSGPFPETVRSAGLGLDGRADGDFSDFDVSGLVDGEGDGARDSLGGDGEVVHALTDLGADGLVVDGVGELGADVAG